MAGSGRLLLAGALGAALLLAPVAAPSAAADERWAYELPRELMSPFCPGRALSECPSEHADRLRMWIVDQARAGRTRAEVEADLFAQWGDQLRQAPRPEGVGLVAYLVPAAFLVAGGALLALFLRRQRGGAAAPAVSGYGGAAEGAGGDRELDRLLEEELRE
jgi:cytochrome c-type biogenesis protein CcmH